MIDFNGLFRRNSSDFKKNKTKQCICLIRRAKNNLGTSFLSTAHDSCSTNRVGGTVAVIIIMWICLMSLMIWHLSSKTVSLTSLRFLLHFFVFVFWCVCVAGCSFLSFKIVRLASSLSERMTSAALPHTSSELSVTTSVCVLCSRSKHGIRKDHYRKFYIYVSRWSVCFRPQPCLFHTSLTTE